jgi:hypothetical protein
VVWTLGWVTRVKAAVNWIGERFLVLLAMSLFGESEVSGRGQAGLSSEKCELEKIAR